MSDQYATSSAPRRGMRAARWVMLAGMLALVAALPYIVERTQYALTRGRLRAERDEAAEQLLRLVNNAELVGLEDTSKVFRLVVQKLAPSVVHIDTVQDPQATERGADEWPLLVPRGDYLRGQGSGVIVDAEGYIVTNYHVVDQARKIQVRLSDGTTTDDVTLVGVDELTDLAVLKIAGGGHPAAEWGDSESLEVGDWVLAMGNPFGLDGTVTSGIVSAKSRRQFSPQYTAYQDFLQTDVAVNPGNSGGPLINTQGQIVGINTAIVGRAFQGISFAVPSATVRRVYDKLLADGRVARGFLGVVLKDLSDDVAEALKLESTRGAVVVEVEPNTPAHAAGIRAGDVILKWQGREVADQSDLILAVGNTPVGETTAAEIVRNGEKLALDVLVAERPPDALLRRPPNATKPKE